MRLHSTAFEHQQPIPIVHTEDGADISPPLHWTDVPADTRELALIVDDPDAPTPSPWVHWVLYHIPATASGLREGLPRKSVLIDPAGAIQGLTTWNDGIVGYRGPAPPKGHGVHHYHFKLYALDKPLKTSADADKQTLLRDMEGHVLAEAELIGTYRR